MRIPKDHHRFILGSKGQKLAALELASATKISIPGPKENSDIVTIIGSKEGIERARHEIQCTSDEQVDRYMTVFQQTQRRLIFSDIFCKYFSVTMVCLRLVILQFFRLNWHLKGSVSTKSTIHSFVDHITRPCRHLWIRLVHGSTSPLPLLWRMRLLWVVKKMAYIRQWQLSWKCMMKR